MGPKDVASLEDALKAKKVVGVLVLADDELRSHALLRALTDVDVPLAWAKLPFAKDSEDLKRWKVSTPGALVLLDASLEPPKLLKVLRAAPPAFLKKQIQEAIK